MRARDNPFAMDRVHTIHYRPQGTTLAGLLVRLKQLNYRAAVVGPDGTGKTTLLEDLARAFLEQGIKTRMVFVNDTSPLSDPACRRLLSELTRDELVLLDGADLVPRSGWSLLKRHTITHAYGLVITSHRPGLLPTLIECTTSLSLLRDITHELQPPGLRLPEDTLHTLFRRHQGNIRACLRELYDLHAREECA